MVGRVSSASAMAICKSRQLKHLLFSNPLVYAPFLPQSLLPRTSFHDVIHKDFREGATIGPLYTAERYCFGSLLWIHSGHFLNLIDKLGDEEGSVKTEAAAHTCDSKTKRKKLKGKRTVVRWLKFFRWKKKKDYARMTAEEKILFKLRKAQRKEERYVEALKKIEPKETSETTHDPEILTPEEHFYFLKMGQKCKNYVPVGRRGVYQGVILNMHLHWKKHQTLQVTVKTFSPEEVKEIATELARLTGGIVLDIQDDNTVIMYRGKNYSQPPTEIMSPRTTLPRKKALDKSKYRDSLRAVRKYIPRLEQELELLRAKAENVTGISDETQLEDTSSVESKDLSPLQMEASKKPREVVAGNDQLEEDDDLITNSDSEDLSDIFESDSETESDKQEEQPLYLNAFREFPPCNDGGEDDFEEHLRQVSKNSKKEKSLGKDLEPELDEVDRLVLRAASLLKKRRR